MEILAVGMSDVATFGEDSFFVKVNATDVVRYVVNRSGKVEAEPPGSQTVEAMVLDLEKNNHAYFVVSPVPIRSIDELPNYLGKFVLQADARTRYTG